MTPGEPSAAVADARERDALMARLLVQQGHCSSEALAACQEAAAGQTDARLGDLLVREGLVGMSQLEGVLGDLRRSVTVACPLCGASYRRLPEDLLAGRERCEQDDCGAVLPPLEAGAGARDVTRIGAAPGAPASSSDASLSADGLDLAGAPDDVRQAASEPARRFGKYILLEVIGKGGMGSVHRAWNTALAQPCAIKFLAAELTTGTGDEMHARRFLREARTAASLSHPNICRVYDVDRRDGRYFITMQLIEGTSLDDLELSPERIVRIFARVAEALGHAHEKDVIHRDIKPGNIMLDREDRPYVTDFGLAKSVDGAGNLTRAGTVIGSPAYMSPEQAHGEALDRRTDIYSLGATLYAVLVGAPPFEGATALRTLVKVTEGPPPPPSARTSGVPRGLEQICLKAMARDVGARYQTAQEMAEALDRLAAGGRPGAPAAPTPSAARRRARPRSRSGRPAAPGRRGGRAAPSRRGLSPAVLAGLVAGGLALVLVLWLALRTPGQAPVEPPPPEVPTPGTSGTASRPPKPPPLPPPPPPPPPPVAEVPEALKVELAALEAEVAGARAREQQTPFVGRTHVRALEQTLVRIEQVLSRWADQVGPYLLRGRVLRMLGQPQAGLDSLERATELGEPGVELQHEQLACLLDLYLLALLECEVCGDGPAWALARRYGSDVGELVRTLMSRGEETMAAALLAYADWQPARIPETCQVAVQGLRGTANPLHVRTLADAQAFLSLRTGRPDERRSLQDGALRLYDLLIKARPGHAPARLMRGWLRMERGLESAGEDVMALLGLRGESPMVWALRGRQMRRQALARPAGADRTRGLEWALSAPKCGLMYDARSVHNLVVRAEIFNELLIQAPPGDAARPTYHARAVEAASQAIAFNPQAHRGYLQRAIANFRAGRTEPALAELALADLERAVARRPDDPELFAMRGGVHWTLKHAAAARADFERALALGHPRPGLIRGYLEKLGG